MSRQMLEIEWDAVRLPGVYKPELKSPYEFNLSSGQSKTARAAFDKSIVISKSSLICFEMHSPSSQAMYPDILRGDFGFPIISLKNSRGTVLNFARGNLKDFFDISRPNTPQMLAIPVAASCVFVIVGSWKGKYQIGRRQLTVSAAGDFGAEVADRKLDDIRRVIARPKKELGSFKLPG